MYLSVTQIGQSLNSLQGLHAFFMTTFLVFKKFRLPVGQEAEFNITAAENEFLAHYFNPAPQTGFYYRVARVGNKTQEWVKANKYASSTLQSTRTKGDLSQALLHCTKGSRMWGWSEGYVQVLKQKLVRDGIGKIPAFDLAVWLYRDTEWQEHATAQTILDRFLAEFSFTEGELAALLDCSLPDGTSRARLFQTQKVSLTQLAGIIGRPEGSPPGRGGTLASLRLSGIGPAPTVSLQAAERVNLITGDNGLGKTFLLECAWWALSGTWPTTPAFPRSDAIKDETTISYEILAPSGDLECRTEAYDWRSQSWPARQDLSTVPGLLIYARVDGAFAIWDPIRNRSPIAAQATADAFVFTREDVWEGLRLKDRSKTVHLCNGLVYDWNIWQSDPEIYPFDTLRRVLRRLSPPDLGRLEPGKPVRMAGGDSLPMPTIRHAYGEVPIASASAGVRRILALAYLIVWTWVEHKAQAQLVREAPQRKLVILIDEIEAHLHPQWQRTILPALLTIQEELDATVDIQFLITTHSPLVLASIEPYFNVASDSLFLFELDRSKAVQLRELRWSKQGDAAAWLLSESFGLQQARSCEAEEAVEAAEALMRNADMSLYNESLRTKDGIHAALIKALPDHDPFWPRWLVTEGLLQPRKRKDAGL